MTTSGAARTSREVARHLASDTHGPAAESCRHIEDVQLSHRHVPEHERDSGFGRRARLGALRIAFRGVGECQGILVEVALRFFGSNELCIAQTRAFMSFWWVCSDSTPAGVL
jgi:hypothetical protein